MPVIKFTILSGVALGAFAFTGPALAAAMPDAPASFPELATMPPRASAELMPANGSPYIVAVSVAVDGTGAPGTCTVTHSSSSQAADDDACRRIIKAGFTPAHDGQGHAAAGTWTGYISSGTREQIANATPSGLQTAADGQNVSARIKMIYPPASLKKRHEGATQINVVLSRTGFPVICQVLQSSGYDDLDQASCDDVLEYGWFQPAVDAKGQPLPRSFATVINWKLTS